MAIKFKMLRIFFILLFLCGFSHDEEILPRKWVVVIDPGHGGVDNGAQSFDGKFLEKNFTLLYAKTLADELKKFPNYQVILTRDQDIFLTPEMRKKIAHEYKADLFISIHADFSSDSNLVGASVYTLSQESIINAKNEIIDKANLKNNFKDNHKQEVSQIMLDMLYHQSKNHAFNIAQIIKNELSLEVSILNKTHRFAELKILKSLEITGVLLEIGFLSNQSDINNLLNYGYRFRFINSVIRAINNFFAETK